MGRSSLCLRRRIDRPSGRYPSSKWSGAADDVIGDRRQAAHEGLGDRLGTRLADVRMRGSLVSLDEVLGHVADGQMGADETVSRGFDGQISLRTTAASRRCGTGAFCG
jgi:hypothetical protein